MSNVTIKLEQLNALAPLKIVKADFVKAKFIELYNTIWDTDKGEAVYERESIFFNRIMMGNSSLQRTTNFSIFAAFIGLAIDGTSLEPGPNALAYLQYTSVETGKNAQGKTTYEGQTVLTLSAYGELRKRQSEGQFKYADNPVIVYEEDEFSFSVQNDTKSVSYTCHYPHRSNHIIAAFMRIIRNDGSSDYAIMLEEDWLRLKGYSEKQNKKRDKTKEANALYSSNNGSIDTGFLKAKLIKHAFKTYPKPRIWRNTALESEQEEAYNQDDLYGVEGGQTAEQQPEQPQAFGPEPDTSAGVQVQDEGDGAF